MRTVVDSGRFFGTQSFQSTPMITAVTINPARVDHIVTVARQFHPHVGIHVRYIYDLFSPRRKGITSLILKAHTYSITLTVTCACSSTTLKVSLFLSIITLAVPCASSSVHHTDSFPLSVLPTISPTNFHIRES